MNILLQLSLSITHPSIFTVLSSFSHFQSGCSIHLLSVWAKCILSFFFHFLSVRSSAFLSTRNSLWRSWHMKGLAESTVVTSCREWTCPVRASLCITRKRQENILYSVIFKRKSLHSIIPVVSDIEMAMTDRRTNRWDD